MTFGVWVAAKMIAAVRIVDHAGGKVSVIDQLIITRGRHGGFSDPLADPMLKASQIPEEATETLSA